MNTFLNELQTHREIVEQIGTMIEEHRPYKDELQQYLPSLTQMIQTILQRVDILELSQAFVLQVLTDIIYGIEHEDEVFLLDVIRYGLLEIYDYILFEWQGSANYEQSDF